MNGLGGGLHRYFSGVVKFMYLVSYVCSILYFEVFLKLKKGQKSLKFVTVTWDWENNYTSYLKLLWILVLKLWRCS